MNYILTSDWHIRATGPRIRKDDYADTQFKKIEWILKTAFENAADVVVAGDIFDAPRCPYWLLIKYMELFKRFKNRIYVVPGQHDLHFHNPELSNTPLGALLSSDVVEIPDSNSIRGVGWGEEFPEDPCNVLVAHMPVTPDEPPFFMEDAISAEDLLEQLDDEYKMVVTGDYHIAHCTITDGSMLCNPGPIMRASKDKMDYVPKIYLYKSDVGSIQMIEIPISEDVFDEETLGKDDMKEYGEDLKELISSFKDKKSYIGFWEVLEDVVSTINPDKGVKDIINQVKERIDEDLR